MRKKIKLLFIIIVLLGFVGIFFWLYKTDYKVENEKTEIVDSLTIVEKEKLVLGYVQDMRVTCYSLVEFTSTGKTASGKWVADGMVASNSLPFGTRLKIEGFDNKIFTVEDRFMTGWTAADLDIYWGDGLDAYRSCLEFGKKNLEVLVLQNKDSVFTK